MFCPYKGVAIRRDACETKTPGGIIIPDNVKESHTPYRGTVVLVGPEAKYVEVGDVVLFDRTGAFTDEINGEKYSFVKNEEDIILVENRNLPSVTDEDYVPLTGKGVLTGNGMDIVVVKDKFKENSIETKLPYRPPNDGYNGRG